MRKLAFAILVLIAVPVSAMDTLAQREYITNQLIVNTHGIETELRFQEMNALCGTRVERIIEVAARGKTYLLQIIDGRLVEDAINCWKQFPEVEYAEPNSMLHHQTANQ